eukprot:366326-Chlamydomonas_euryale.AAC.7
MSGSQRCAGNQQLHQTDTTRGRSDLGKISRAVLPDTFLAFTCAAVLCYISCSTHVAWPFLAAV